MTYHFILAVTTYNRISYLRECLESFEKTKCNNTWTIIVADDGSTDGTQDLVRSMGYQLIQNHRSGVSNQTNSIFQEINHIEFDCCFKIDDDITFLKKGWSEAYHSAIVETGYDHLVFTEVGRAQQAMKCRGKRTNPTFKYNLRSTCDYINTQGCFYTVTRKVLKEVGYFDTQTFGPHESGHVDFTARCCNAGMNDYFEIYDLDGSEDFINLKQDDDYNHSLPPDERESRRVWCDPYINEEEFNKKSNSRIYYPFNSTMYTVDKPKSSVIIGAYNSKNLGLVLEGFKYQTDKNFEIIIINDGGDEIDLLSLLRLYSDYLNINYDILLPKSSDYRLSEVRNLGVKMARSNRIITTDADCIPSKNFIWRHNNSTTDITIGVRNRIYQTIARNITNRSAINIDKIPSYYDERFNYPIIIDWSNEDAADMCWGCNISYNKELVLKAGNFNKEYVGWGFEDCDMALRILRQKATVKLDMNCITYHLEHTTKCDWSNEQQLANLKRYRELRQSKAQVSGLIL